MSDRICSQINFLHKKVGKSEWSGILLYSHKEGDISEANELVMLAEEIFLMDIGSSAYTEYENDTDSIIELVDNYPRFEEGNLKIGHIHTHHNMGANFSGTDMSELQENAPSHNYYLSLVVDFKCDPVAKIATECEFTDGKISHPGANEKVVKPVESQKRLGVYDVLVTQENDQRFLDRYSKVKKQVKERKKKATTVYPKKHTRGGYNRAYDQSYGYGYGRGYNGKNSHMQGKKNHNRTTFYGPDMDSENIDEFIYKWLNLNANIPAVGGAETAIYYLEGFLQDDEGAVLPQYVDTVMENFEDYAVQIMGEGYNLTDDEFIKLAKICKQKFEDVETDLAEELAEQMEIYKEDLEEEVKQ